MSQDKNCNPNCICMACAEHDLGCKISDCPWCAGDGIEYIEIMTPMAGEIKTLACAHFKPRRCDNEAD